MMGQELAGGGHLHIASKFVAQIGSHTPRLPQAQPTVGASGITARYVGVCGGQLAPREGVLDGDCSLRHALANAHGPGRGRSAAAGSRWRARVSIGWLIGTVTIKAQAETRAEGVA
jgi:hypothetical protein